MRTIKKIIFIFFILASLLLHAQQFTINKIGLENGISDSYILSIAQDEDGLMWFGTEWGLNKFDGNSFTKYLAYSPDSNSISHNGINKLLVDTTENLIWIGTKGKGLNTFNYRTQQFYHFPLHTNEPNATRANGITDICFDINGDLWLSTYRAGLRKLDKQSKNIKTIDLKDIQLPEIYHIWCIEDDLKGHLYIGHWGEGLSVISTIGLKSKHFEYNPNYLNCLPGNKIVDICIDDRDNVWLGTENGLAIYHPGNDNFTVFKYNENNPGGISNDEIHSITQINNEIWIGTWKGGVNIVDLDEADLNDSENVHFKHIPCNNLQSGLSSPSIESIYSDSFGNIWLGSYGKGLNVISHVKPYFNTLTYSKTKADINGLSINSVNCLTFDNDSLLYAGLDEGFVDIYKVNFDDNTFIKKQTLKLNNNIICLLADNEDNLWFGKKKGGLEIYNKSAGKLQRPDFLKNELCSEYISCLYEDKEQNIWIGTDCGIIKYNPKSKSTQKVSGKAIGLIDDLIRQIVQDVNGNFWIGSAINGVVLISPDFKMIEHFYVGNGLGAHNINDIYEDSQHRIWIATKIGVTCFPNVKNNNYNSFIIDIKNGLNDNFTRSVIEGNQGEIWFMTNAGITKFTEKENKFEYFNQKDGIPWGTFNSGASIKSTDGTILLGSQGGICYYNSKNNVYKQNLPPTIITKLEVYDFKTDSTFYVINLDENKNIKLKYPQNTLTFSFNVMDYALNNIVEYSYQLKGIDDDTWHSIKSDNEIIFRNLPPGQYTFYVRAKIHNQETPSKFDSISFRIEPPVLLSWWAILLYLAMIIFISYTIILFYRRKLILENQLNLEKQNHFREQEINNERLQFFTNITHELKTPLTLILSPVADLLKKESDNKKLNLIHKNTVRLNELINQLLEFRKSETSSKQLTIKKENISKILFEIVLKFKELNPNNDVDIEFSNSPTTALYLDKEVFTVIMDNLISNSFKNTPKGKIEVIIEEKNENDNSFTEITVKDTGIGIPENELDKIFERYYQVKRELPIPGTGIGLSIVNKYVKLHKATIDVTSKVNEGTSFTIRFNNNEQYPLAIHIEDNNKKPIKDDKNNQSLLVIEDNEDIRNYVAEIFESRFEIYTAQNGQEGLQLAQNKMPDIIISDIMMPVMDGIELCKNLKSNIKTSHIPIILLTAKDQDQEKTQGYLTGADSYITKPFNSELLESRVQNILQNRDYIANYFISGQNKKDKINTSLTKLDNDFIKKTISTIENNIDKEQMSIQFLASQQKMSYSTFTRKIKTITGLTVTELVKDIKMQHAEQILLEGKFTISETANQLGYSSMAYFRKAFKEKYGTSPSQFFKKFRKKP